ncbi:MAG: GDSL-type esterase/lipase family protein [Salinivirgaceae bacterium]|jgi:archaellum component FlaG (FlaF/FlaG flagellin family)|nr:GDSL-type esterase/lipase family protein [Salinivirgaceae bacterium]
MKRISIVSLLLIAIAFSSFGQLTVAFDNANIAYMGRSEVVDNKCVRFYWPGSSATIKFKGTDIKAVIENVKENTYFYAIVDGDERQIRKIKPDTVKSAVLLASNLSKGKHTVQLFKLSNNTSVTSFYGFELNEGASVCRPDRPGKKKIEFYGNSITAGHGVDVLPGEKDSGAPQYFNNYLTYAARTARHYNAQYSCIARSGIGIMVSWFPEIMPEIYDRVNPADPTSKWDFSKYTPDVVVVNLYQNDMWITSSPEEEQFKARFGTTAPDSTKIISSYQAFISLLRSKYPKASIICTLGSMNATAKGSSWPGYVEKVVEGMKDAKIYNYFFTFKNTGGHPKAFEQKVMADELIRFIDQNIKW